MLEALTGFVVVGVAIALGYAVGRTGILGEHARYVLSRLVFYVLSPVLLFTILARADVRLLFSALLPVSMLAAVTMIVVFVVAMRIIAKRPLGDVVIGSLASGQVNANNIGIPLSLYMLGSAAYSAPVILFQLLILMPIALALLDAATSGSRSFSRIVRQTVRNPMLIASILGVGVALVDIELPAVVNESLVFVANACVPVMLISFGMSLFGQRVLTLPGRRVDVLVAVALKLVVMPVAAWGFAALLGLSPRDTFVVVFLAALPTAQNVFAFAQRYDTGEILARDVVLLTTFGCLPVLVAVTLLLG